MDICFYRHSLLNRGGDKIVLQYADHLATRGHRVSIAANVINTVFQTKASLLPISRWRYKIGTIINAVFRKRSEDVIVPDIIMMAFLLSFRNRKRIIYFAQDYNETVYNSSLMRFLTRGVYYYCLTVLKVPVIAVSDQLAELLRKGFHAEVAVARNGVDTDLFHPELDLRYYARKGESTVILLFARPDHRKGFDTAIKVLSEFRPEIESRKIAIWTVGDSLQVPFPVSAFGFVVPDELRKILSSSDILLYPSRYEGFGLLPLEAMACGCAVVTTDAVPYARDAGLPVTPAEDSAAMTRAVRQLVTQKELLHQTKQAGVEIARQFTIKAGKAAFESAVLTFAAQRTKTNTTDAQ